MQIITIITNYYTKLSLKLKLHNIALSQDALRIGVFGGNTLKFKNYNYIFITI